MKLYDAVGRPVEAGNRIWISAARHAPYEAFRERPRDDPDVDVRSPLAIEDGGPVE